jgi:uncharacterized repeat protein (TIGR01451 family)
MAQRACASVLGTLLFSLVTFAQSPNLSITKTADATPVPTGTNIGFTIKISNSNAAGTGTAFNVVMTDQLPVASIGLDFVWTISPAYTGPGTCTINGAPIPVLLLNCKFGDLSPGAQATIHVQTGTQAPPGSNAGTYVAAYEAAARARSIQQSHS